MCVTFIMDSKRTVQENAGYISKFCRFEIVFLAAMYFLKEKVTFIAIFIWFAFLWFASMVLCFFLLEFKLIEGRSLSKISPKHRE